MNNLDASMPTTHIPPEHIPPEPSLDPAPKKHHGRTLLVAAVAALALVCAFTAGAAITPAPEPSPPKTVTRTVPVPTTPAACTQAIELGQRIIMLAGESLAATSEGWDAASRFDAAGIDLATAKVNAITPQVDLIRPQYQAARDECLAS